jgi:MFS family permease
MSPTALIAKAYGSFHPDSVPVMSRANYRRELAGALFFPVGLAAVEGSVIAIVVKQGFDRSVPATALAFVVGLLAAAPEMANITSFFWAALSHGRHKIRFLTALQAIVLAMVVVVALAPRTTTGLVALAVAVVIARVCMAGVFMLRATMWGTNYERRHRARITSKFSTVQVVVIATAALLIGYMQDASREYFRGILLGMALIGAVGVAAYSRVRLRGHRKLIRTESGVSEEERPTLNPLSSIRVLRQDRAYARFMVAMFIIGTGNLMLVAPLTLTLSDQFKLGALQCMIIASSLPYFTIPFAIPFWSRLLAKKHVVAFRAVHSWFFVASQAVVLIAARYHRLDLMYVGAILQGIGFAGGSLAWNLGHLDFAPPHKAAQYMGVHVSLNGIRGMIAPFVAVAIYEALRTWRPGTEYYVFLTSVVLCAVGAICFMRLARDMDLARTHPLAAAPTRGT